MPGDDNDRSKARIARASEARAAQGHYLCQCRSGCAAVGGLVVAEGTIDRHRARDREQHGTCLPLPVRIDGRRRDDYQQVYSNQKARFDRTGLAKAPAGRYRCQCRAGGCADRGGLVFGHSTLDRHRLKDIEKFGTSAPLPDREPKGMSGGDSQGEEVDESEEEDQLDGVVAGPSSARPTKRARLSVTPASAPSSTQSALPRAHLSPQPLSDRSSPPPRHNPDRPLGRASADPTAIATALNPDRQRQVDQLIAQLAAEQAAEDEANSQLEREKADRRKQFSRLFKATRKDAKRLANADDIEAAWAQFCAAQRDREREAAALMGDSAQEGGEDDDRGGSRHTAGLSPARVKVERASGG